MPKFQLVLVLHAHQPVGNFEEVLERSYARCYLPFLEVLARHPGIGVGLHFSGSLLEWIERAHPQYIERLRELVRMGQVEILGGGFYEPILVAIPEQDRVEQLQRMADFIAQRFGARPRGAWLAERVWEPNLPTSLAAAGVEYTLVDDNHFLGVGFEAGQLYGHYRAEDQGNTVNILPGLKELRYMVPFRSPNEITDFLRTAATRRPGGMAVMGDDLEKFGSWPETHEHCYRDGWLENFFLEIEKNSDWLETATPSEAIAAGVPMGRADLGSASYTEMMEWALPTAARRRFRTLANEFATRGDDSAFVRGGHWRGFLSKYPESNLLHKKMIHVSRKVRALEGRRDRPYLDARAEMNTHLLRGQCNDAYWHGVFGGLYSPHLRAAVWRSLQRAETIADKLAQPGWSYQNVAKLDFDADGHDELYFTSNRYTALLSPFDGATVSAIDCRGSGATLMNSLARRPEAYHSTLKTAATSDAPAPQSIQSIHGQVRTKEEGLSRWLHYDRWLRNCFRLLVFGREKSLADFAAANLDEDGALAGGLYRTQEFSPQLAAFASAAKSDWSAEKKFTFAPTAEGFEIGCEITVERVAPGKSAMYAGIESVLNFLAPSSPDRYFGVNGQRFPLRWSAATAANEVRVVDEWQKISVYLQAPGANEFWVVPIETVSESEDGFERIYQGSQIAALWPVELAQGEQWTGLLLLTVAALL